MSTFQERAQACATNAGFQFPLTEDQLAIAKLTFIKGREPMLEIEGNDHNQNTRMWFEALHAAGKLGNQFLFDSRTDWTEYSRFLTGETTVTDRLCDMAKEFFGDEFWSEATADKHQSIYGLKNADAIKFTLKDGAERILLPRLINYAWERRADITPDTDEPFVSAVYCVINMLNEGILRSAEPQGCNWTTNDWVKKACLLFFRISENEEGAGGISWDKVPLKCEDWDNEDFEKAKFRMMPSAIVRTGAYIGENVVLMAHSFVNMGAYVGKGTMIDTGARVGSCAQVGSNVHLGAGSGVGGVFEPLQATPTIIEDDVFVSAMCEVAEGSIIGRGAVLGMGTMITATTKIFDRSSGQLLPPGVVPAYSVVVPGSLPDPSGGPSINCAVIVKQVDERTRSKTGINELLRE